MSTINNIKKHFYQSACNIKKGITNLFSIKLINKLKRLFTFQREYNPKLTTFLTCSLIYN